MRYENGENGERNIRKKKEGPQGREKETTYNKVDNNVGEKENIWPIALVKEWTRLSLRNLREGQCFSFFFF